MQKLCDVYDVVSAVDIPESENHTQLVRVGFTKKKVDYVVTVTADGGFSSVSALDKEECVVPTTPEAEGRTGANGAPYPLAENLKYFAEEEGAHNALLDRYIAQLTDWCAQGDAPVCLKTLLTYLEKRTLLADLRDALPKKLKLHKDDAAMDFGGADAKAMICFAVEDYDSPEMRLWKRRDVQDSWSAYCARRAGGEAALCYVTGEELPLLDNHPKVQGNAKLISAKDAGYPFQYKGRFAEDRSAATVSAYASDRAHRALQYLMTNQGLSFRRFGLNVVAWNVQTGAVKVPLDEDERDEDDVELPDTFEIYARTLCEAVKGDARTPRTLRDCIENLSDGEARAASVVIMSMEAATDGRMSIDYYQELPDDVYIDRLTEWYRTYCWTYWDKASAKNVVRTPMPLAIAEAVMGPDSVSRAKSDLRCEKSDGKQMRVVYKRLLSCIVDGAPLPRSLLESAIRRAAAPLTFHDKNGSWRRYQWETCMRTTCALIRRGEFDRRRRSGQETGDAFLPNDTLDRQNRDRSYLYGRLLALADIAECEAADRPEQRSLPTNAIRLTQRFAQRPKETWLQLHMKLTPYLASLGDEGRANGIMRMFAEIESLFDRADRESSAALDGNFLIGYLAQRRDFYTKHEATAHDGGQKEAPVNSFGADRSERFGMLCAIADCAERRATLEETDGRKVSAHDGKTAALRMMARMVQQPAMTWTEIHAKLLPYLEKLGIRGSSYYIAMLRAAETGFGRADRLSNAPLDSMFLNGFYRMRAFILAGGKPDLPAQSEKNVPDMREAVYAALLAIENDVERAVLDLEKDEEDNRTSNALRLMTKFATSPDTTWRYLENRMQPYLKKLRSVRAGWAERIEARIGELEDIIRENGWESDEPLMPGWLHDYYTFK